MSVASPTKQGSGRAPSIWLKVGFAGKPAWQSRLQESRPSTRRAGRLLWDFRQAMCFNPIDRPCRGTLTAPLRSAALSFKERAPFTASLDLGEGNLLLGAPSHAVLVLAQFGSQPRKITLPASLGSPPVRWGKGFAVATVAGQIHLLDASTGEPLAEPFQPRLTPDKSASWLQPVVAGTAADARLVATDGMDNLYALEIDASPTPHLAASATGKVGDAPLITRLAAAGDRVFAGDVNGGITLYAQSDLQVANRADLGARDSPGAPMRQATPCSSDSRRAKWRWSMSPAKCAGALRRRQAFRWAPVGRRKVCLDCVS